MSGFRKQVNKWVGECLRKNKLKEKWANRIIHQAQSEGTYLRKYYCPHCQHWHVTRQREHKQAV